MMSEILCIIDVKKFAKAIIKEGIIIHPDDNFHDYTRYSKNQRFYTWQEAEFRNRLMDDCFRICQTFSEDIYSIMGDVLLVETRMDKFIPLSTDFDNG